MFLLVYLSFTYQIHIVSKFPFVLSQFTIYVLVKTLDTLKSERNVMAVSNELQSIQIIIIMIIIIIIAIINK